jgi:hypothetical protein
MDRAAINTINIHIVRLIILVPFTLVITSLLYGREDHPHERFLRL